MAAWFYAEPDTTKKMDSVWARYMTALTKHALQRMSHGHKGKGKPKNTWKKDLEKMWTAGYKYSGGRWRRSREQSWVEKSGLWPMFNRDRQDKSSVSLLSPPARPRAARASRSSHLRADDCTNVTFTKLRQSHVNSPWARHRPKLRRQLSGYRKS